MGLSHGVLLGERERARERERGNSAQHYTLYALRGGDERIKCEGLMLRQLYSTMGESGVPVLPCHEGSRELRVGPQLVSLPRN